MDLTNSNTKKGHWLSILFCSGIFLSMFIFFFCFHPLVILDADDWQYVSYVRPALPYPGFWNPSRILPEILMPFCGTISLVIHRIFQTGYIESQTFVFGVVLAGAITVYVMAFVNLMKTKFSISGSEAKLLGIVFLTLHFLLFRTADSGNLYMFSSYDTCCYFYYTIPALLNCSLVMYFSCRPILNNFFSGKNLLRKAFLLLVLYLAVFSNLFNSIILVSYLGCDFLMDLAYIIRRKERFSSLLKADLFQLLIIFLWLAAVLLESLGGRGSGYWPKKEYIGNLQAIFRMLPGIAKSLSPLFILISAGSIIAATSVFLINRKNVSRNSEKTAAPVDTAEGFANSSDSVAESNHLLFEFFDLHFTSAIIMVIFLALLCARVDKTYFTRPQVMFGYIFSLFVIIVSCMAYILKQYKNLVIFFPLMLLIMLSMTNSQGITFAPSNTLGLSEQICISIDNDLINQMKSADKDGTERLALQVMNTGEDNNWPHTAHVAYGLKQTLLKHGIISRDFEIVPEMSTEFNDRNGIDIDVFWPDIFRSFYPTLY